MGPSHENIRRRRYLPIDASFSHGRRETDLRSEAVGPSLSSELGSARPVDGPRPNLKRHSASGATRTLRNGSSRQKEQSTVEFHQDDGMRNGSDNVPLQEFWHDWAESTAGQTETETVSRSSMASTVIAPSASKTITVPLPSNGPHQRQKPRPTMGDMKWQSQPPWHLNLHLRSQVQLEADQHGGTFPAHRSPVSWDHQDPLPTNMPDSVLDPHTEDGPSIDHGIHSVPSQPNAPDFFNQLYMGTTRDEVAGIAGSTSGSGVVSRVAATTAGDRRAGTTVRGGPGRQTRETERRLEMNLTLAAGTIGEGGDNKSELAEAAGHTTTTTTTAGPSIAAAAAHITCQSPSPIVPAPNTQHPQPSLYTQHARHLSGAQYHHEHHHHPEYQHQHQRQHQHQHQHQNSDFHEYEPQALVPLAPSTLELHRLGSGTSAFGESSGTTPQPKPRISHISCGDDHHLPVHQGLYDSPYHSSQPAAPALPSQWPAPVCGSTSIPVSVTSLNHSVQPTNHSSSSQTPVSPANFHEPPRPTPSDVTDSAYPYAAVNLNPGQDHHGGPPTWNSATPVPGFTLAITESCFTPSLPLWPNDQHDPSSSSHLPSRPAIYPPPSSDFFSPVSTFASHSQYASVYTDPEIMMLPQQDSTGVVGNDTHATATQPGRSSQYASRTASDAAHAMPLTQPAVTQATHHPTFSTPTMHATPHDGHQKPAATSASSELSAGMSHAAPNPTDVEPWLEMKSIHLGPTQERQPASTETSASRLPMSELADPQSRQRITRGCFSDKERQETAETRRMKACMRCRIQRVRVRSLHPLPLRLLLVAFFLFFFPFFFPVCLSSDYYYRPPTTFF